MVAEGLSLRSAFLLPLKVFLRYFRQVYHSPPAQLDPSTPHVRQTGCRCPRAATVATPPAGELLHLMVKWKEAAAAAANHLSSIASVSPPGRAMDGGLRSMVSTG